MHNLWWSGQPYSSWNNHILWLSLRLLYSGCIANDLRKLTAHFFQCHYCKRVFHDYLSSHELQPVPPAWRLWIQTFSTSFWTTKLSQRNVSRECKRRNCAPVIAISRCRFNETVSAVSRCRFNETASFYGFLKLARMLLCRATPFVVRSECDGECRSVFLTPRRRGRGCGGCPGCASGGIPPPATCAPSSPQLSSTGGGTVTRRHPRLVHLVPTSNALVSLRVFQCTLL